MGTKLNPGKFDCYEKAKPDEPMFVLLARDKTAPTLVRLWACIHEGNVFEAVEQFNHLVKYIDVCYPDDAKSVEAAECANEMEIWKEGN